MLAELDVSVVEEAVFAESPVEAVVLAADWVFDEVSALEAAVFEELEPLVSFMITVVVEVVD